MVSPMIKDMMGLTMVSPIKSIKINLMATMHAHQNQRATMVAPKIEGTKC